MPRDTDRLIDRLCDVFLLDAVTGYLTERLDDLGLSALSDGIREEIAYQRKRGADPLMAGLRALGTADLDYHRRHGDDDDAIDEAAAAYEHARLALRNECAHPVVGDDDVCRVCCGEVES